MALKFDTSFDPAYGQAVTVAPDVQRITARNPSPFTFHGTNSYLVGRDTLAVIDPGPDDDCASSRHCSKPSGSGRSATSSSATRIATIHRWRPG